MALQGLLAQSKPVAATNTLLYSAAINESASTVLTIANDGTAAAYSVGLKSWDQKLQLDSANYLLHPKDVVTGYRLTVDTAMSASTGLTGGQTLTTDDAEKNFIFESFYIPPFTEIFVKDVSLRQVTLESVNGSYEVGDTVEVGTAPDNTTALVYDVSVNELNTVVTIGPSTINGAGAEFVEGDILATTAGASGTIAAGGIGTSTPHFVFSTTTAGGVYSSFLEGFAIFNDRAYRFDVSDSSMTGRDFKLSTDVNGEWGTDGVFGTLDDGTEYTTNLTTNGTAGSAGAYVQYGFAGTAITGNIYYYDGGTGTAGNSVYGGSNRNISFTTEYQYFDMFVYDISSTLTDNTDSFTFNGVTFVITGQTPGPYGVIREYSGTTAYVIKGINSPDFAGTNTFQDNPLSDTAQRSVVTVSSVLSGVTDLEDENYLTVTKANTASNVDRITSLVVGPGERVIVNSATQNNVFSLVGFEDVSTAFTPRVNLQSLGGTP